MKPGRLRTLVAVLLLLTACREAPSPVSALVRQQYKTLNRVGASFYAPDEFSSYEKALNIAEDALLSERRKWIVFRDYESVDEMFESAYKLGGSLLSRVARERALRAQSLYDEMDRLSVRLDAVRRLSTMVNEGRLVRRRVTRAHILLTEARAFMERADFDLSESRLAEASLELNASLEPVRDTLFRYSDVTHIARWRKDADAVIAESRRDGGHAIVVNKATRTLTLYRNGHVVKTYAVGLGMNGSSDKMVEGDRATPEGRYRVVRKVSASKYYLALLLNYPNDEDRRRFAEAKKQGQLPKGARIGGLVEIHGGGKDSLTNGCVSMENPDMEELFRVAGEGTPVAIVGALRKDNRLSTALEGLER